MQCQLQFKSMSISGKRGLVVCKGINHLESALGLWSEHITLAALD